MLSISYSFSPTTIIQSSQVNQNFSDIVSYINSTVCFLNMVVGFKGAIVDIPTGWVLDNDLKDRMIIGAGNLYNVGDTGGEASHALIEAELAVHTHIQNAHLHSIEGKDSGQDTSTGRNRNFIVPSGGGTWFNVSSTTATNQNTGSGTAHNNLPPFYAMAWIRKS